MTPDRDRLSSHSLPIGRLPDFLIVGAGKAGTTSLAAWLRAHPQVFIPVEKELHYFDRHWERGIDWYKAQFAEAAPDVRAGEATPEYMIHPAYIDRVAGVVPGARLIVMLRNPIDRARSQYDHMVARGDRAWEPYRRFDGRAGPRSFAELVELELEVDPSDWRTAGMCLARGRYIDQMRSISVHYPRDRIHVVLYDDLVDDPAAQFASVCRFLEVDERIRPAIVGRAFDPLELMGAKAGEDDHGDLLATAIPGRRGGLPDPDQGSRLPRREPIPVALRAKLVEYFRPYNDELAEWLGVELSKWNR